MKQVHIIGVLLGLLSGLGIAVVMRPSLPMFGQPPIDVAFAALRTSCQASQIDCAYAGQFWQVLLVCCLVGAVAGFGVAFLVDQKVRQP